MQLRELSLDVDGDRHERRMWPLVAALFPSYQVFWRAYIVPMSYRTESTLTKMDPEWYRLRAGIPPHFERLAMAHYSVFYWAARGMERLKVSEASYPEDVLFLFDSALDCIDIFIGDIRRVAKDCGLKFTSIPKEQVSKSAAAFRTVRAYRNTILHNPVLGRGISLDGTFIVKEDHLRTAKESWSLAGSLPAEAFVNAAQFLDQVADEFMRALEDLWSSLTTELLTSPSFDQKFLNSIDVSQSRCAPIEALEASALSTISASGAFLMRAKVGKD